MSKELQQDIDNLKLRVSRLEDTIQTQISWQMREFGEAGVQQLLDILVNGIPRASKTGE